MNSADYFRVNNNNVIHEAIDGEVVIVNLNSGCYYSMENLGALIWSFLVDHHLPVSKIADAIADRYVGNREDIESEIKKLVSQLVQEDLIVPDQVQQSNDGASSCTPVVSAQADKLRFEEPVLNKYTDMEDLLLLDPIHDVDEAGWPNTNPNTHFNRGA